MIKALITRRLLATLVWSISINVWADINTSNLPTEEVFLGEIPIVLSVTRLQQPVNETPAAITLIDREMIEASGARDIADLLRLVPGFQVAHESGHVHTVTHHGLSDQFSRRMQVLVDGRSIYSPAIGGVEWTELPLSLDDIERIEVIRGPNAATHGANAFLGVISISTRHSSEVDGGLIRLNKGQNGITDGFFRYADSKGDLDYRVTLGYRSDDGFDNRHDTKHVRLVNLRADYQASAQDTLELQLGYSEGPREDGFPDDLTWQSGTTDRNANYQLLRWQHVLEPTSELYLQFYHNFEEREEIRRGMLFVPFSADAYIERYDLEFYQTLQIPDDHRLVWGASLRRDEVYAPFLFNDDDILRNDLYRLFANLEWRFTPRLIMNAGVMQEKNDITGADLSPRLAFNYHLAPSHTVRAGISKALRTPVFFEDQSNMRATLVPPFAPPSTPVLIYTSPGNLDPEEIISRELGYVGEFASGALLLDVKLFRDSMSQLINAIPVTPNPNFPMPAPRQWANENSATVTGLETQLQWRPTPEGRLIFSYGYADVDSTSDQLEKSTPRHTLSLLGIYRFPGKLTGSAVYYRVDEQLWLDTGDLIPGYDRLDVRLAQGFSYGGKNGEVAFVVQNVLDDYKDFRYSTTVSNHRNIFDTGAYLSISLEF